MIGGTNQYRQPQSRDEECPRRGPALPHHQDITVFSDGRCTFCQVRLREVAPAPDPVRDMALREAGIPPEADDQPLSLPQPGRCQVNHGVVAAKVPRIGNEGLEWQRCPACQEQCEPALVTKASSGIDVAIPFALQGYLETLAYREPYR